MICLTRRAFVLALTAGGVCLAGPGGCGHFFQPGYTSRATRLLEVSGDLKGLGDGPGFGQLFPDSLTTATTGWTVPADPQDPAAGGPATQPASGPTSRPSTAPATQPTTAPSRPEAGAEVVVP